MKLSVCSYEISAASTSRLETDTKLVLYVKNWVKNKRFRFEYTYFWVRVPFVFTSNRESNRNWFSTNDIQNQLTQDFFISN